MNNEEATLYIAGLTAILQAIALIPRDPKNQTEADEKALSALSEAYYETHKYYEFLRTHTRDVSREFTIAQKWEWVGFLMQKYDSTLAQRLNAKSRYWMEGATWSNAIVREAGIGLEEIRREVVLRIKPAV